jgi:hypothetical protein
VSDRLSALETLWKHVLDRWEEDAAHRAFLEHCQRNDLLVGCAIWRSGTGA